MSVEERRLPVDRTRAAARAAWLLALGLLFSLGAWLAASRGIRWRTMWSADPVTLTALAFLLLLLCVIALWLLARGARWLGLACWPRPAEVTISAEAIVLRLGPFGTHVLDWGRVRAEFREVEPDVPAMEDDPALPDLRHPAFAGEICERMMQFCGVSPVDLDGILAPFMERNRARWGGSAVDRQR